MHVCLDRDRQAVGRRSNLRLSGRFAEMCAVRMSPPRKLLAHLVSWWGAIIACQFIGPQFPRIIQSEVGAFFVSETNL